MKTILWETSTKAYQWPKKSEHENHLTQKKSVSASLSTHVGSILVTCPLKHTAVKICTVYCNNWAERAFYSGKEKSLKSSKILPKLATSTTHRRLPVLTIIGSAENHKSGGSPSAYFWYVVIIAHKFDLIIVIEGECVGKKKLKRLTIARSRRR